jgi:phosphoglycerate dehydrogenase-like enzyme
MEEAEVLFAYAITPSILRSAPGLKWFHSVTTGPDLFYFPGLVQRNITVTTPRGVYSVPIAETVIGLMLALTRKLHRSLEFQAQRTWGKIEIMEELTPPAGELQEMTAVIIGPGGIGSEVAKRCKCLEMNVIAVTHTARKKPDFIDTLVPTEELDGAVKKADFLIICCPLTEETKGLIDSRRLSLMKQSAFLINVARGAIVDETALIRVLRAGEIGGAALDVFTEEPLPDGHAFFTLPNVIVTPRIAGWSSRTWKRSMERFITNYERYLKNEPLEGVVDFKRGY